MEGKKRKEFPMDGTDMVEDTKVRMEDSKLFTGTCTMGGCEVSVMIKKGPEIKKETYNIMRNFQHNTVIRHLNFYPDSNVGRLVIPLVKESFQNWIGKEGRGLLIDGNGDMSELCKTMIIDICDAVDSLCEKDILIKNFDHKNLYMAKERTHRILVLVTEAETMKNFPEITKWQPIRDIIEWCYKECKAEPSVAVTRYIKFIGTKHFTVKRLGSYPLNWDNYTKGEYILCLIAASQNVIKSAMRPAGISWPKQDDKLPNLLQQIVEAHQAKGFYYDPKIRFDYINLIRNTYKHFNKLPSHIKMRLGTLEGFIEVVEEWSPTIWYDLYDEIGWPIDASKQ